MNAGAVSRQQYLVVLPPGAGPGITGPRLPQTDQEKKLSTDRRKVATLAKDELETLQNLFPGVEVYPNPTFHVPDVHEMGWSPVPEKVLRPLLQESVQIHGADKLHAQGIKGNSSPFAPIVVTVDTGVAPHQDLQAERRLKFYDVFQEAEVDWNDPRMHGTHVSGIMAANGEVVGMAPQAQLIGVRVLDENGDGTPATVLKGLEKAAEYYDQLCKPSGRTMVLNLSLGGEAPLVSEDGLHRELPRILDGRPGLVICFAAGNTGPAENTIHTPGTFVHERAITVAGLDTKDTLPTFDDEMYASSSRGGNDVEKGQDALRRNGIMADGTQVLSTVGTDQYARIDGTSMATPHVAGAAALLWDLAGKLHAEGRLSVKPAEVNPLVLLKDAARDTPAFPPDAEGSGALQVDKAAELLVQRFTKPPAA